MEKGERPIRLLEAATLAGILKCSIDRMLLPDEDAEIVSRLWQFEHDLAISAQELAAAARDYEDRKWALRFVVEDMNKRMPSMDAAMQPKIQIKMSSAKKQLQDSPENIVARELETYRSQVEDGGDFGKHPEKG